MKENYTPDISSKFQEIYDFYFDNNGDPELAIEQINIFLKDFPYYTEALIFKARMLMAIGENLEALQVIESVETYDKWRLIGKFDKAEIYLEENQQSESIETFAKATELYLSELQDGIESFFICLDDPGHGDELKKGVFKILSSYLDNPENEGEVSNKIREYLQANSSKLIPCK